MPRYFLDVSNAKASNKDEAGAEFADLDAARQEAIAGIRSILGDELLGGEIDLNGEVRIFDEQRRLVLTIPYSDAVTVVAWKG